jgi:hypothetical protein
MRTYESRTVRMRPPGHASRSGGVGGRADRAESRPSAGFRRTWLLATLLGLCACTPRATLVPVAGAEPDVTKLEGRWSGDYWSAESGRSGSIVFDLVAGRDTASGSVLMTPSMRTSPDPERVMRAADEVIGIAFVIATDGAVQGRLEPYRDPECGCQLATTFRGRLTADTIRGTFSSLHIEGGIVQHGEWRVVRRHAPD